MVAKYQDDLSSYIWQPYGSPPPFFSASLFVYGNDASSVPRALILFSTTRSLLMFRERYDSVSKVFSQIQSPAIGLLHTVYATFRVALTETKEFLQDVSLQVFEMVKLSINLKTDTDTLSPRLSKSKTPIKREISASTVPQRL